jgi:hypothetical protein
LVGTFGIYTLGAEVERSGEGKGDRQHALPGSHSVVH